VQFQVIKKSPDGAGGFEWQRGGARGVKGVESSEVLEKIGLDGASSSRIQSIARSPHHIHIEKALLRISGW
jgi:hypothetical protein